MTNLAKLSLSEVLDKYQYSFKSILKTFDDLMECSCGSDDFLKLTSIERCNEFHTYTLIRGLINNPSEENIIEFKNNYGSLEDAHRFVDKINKHFREVSGRIEMTAYEEIDQKTLVIKHFLKDLYQAA